MSNATRSPLSWPTGWVRTPAGQRQRAHFGKVTVGQYGRGKQPLSVSQATDRLVRQCALLGAREEILSTNLVLRLDGYPRSDQPNPSDPGAALYFTLKKQPTALACDRWDRIADNIAAIAMHIDALRAIERYGVGSLAQAFAGYAALPPKGGETDWRVVLGMNGDVVSLGDVEARYRELARLHHPDIGGDPEQMSRLNAARDAARKALT